MNLNQITIHSQDLVKSVAFYKKLGLKLIVDSIPRYARFTLPQGEATFSIHHTDKKIGENGPVIYFECENLDEKVEELIGLGVEFDLLPKDQEWLWREAHLTDSDGNKLILYKAGENRVNPPWKINS